jgi:hypothetical protein
MTIRRFSARLGVLHRNQLFIMTYKIQKTDAEWKALLARKAPSPWRL